MCVEGLFERDRLLAMPDLAFVNHINRIFPEARVSVPSDPWLSRKERDWHRIQLVEALCRLRRVMCG